MIEMRDAVKHKTTMEQVDSMMVKFVPRNLDNVCVHSSETNLTAEEAEAADWYRKILKMHGPPFALTAEETKVSDKYRKMLNFLIPIDAVWLRMMMDQIDDKIISVVLGSILNENNVETLVKSKRRYSCRTCIERTFDK